MLKHRRALDTFDDIPHEMALYLRHNGYHFNKKMYEFAVSTMYRETNGKRERMQPETKDKVTELLKKYNATPDNDVLYDTAYLYSMIMCDFFGKSLRTEQDVATHIKAMADDPDKPDGYVFNRFYADMCFCGIPIDWEEMV